MQVRFKKVHPDAVIPTKAHPSDAGFDLTAIGFALADECLVYHTGIAVEIPEGYVGLIFPRSSVAKQDLFLTNCVGVIDSHYRGEILFKFKAAFGVYDDCPDFESEVTRYEGIGRMKFYRKGDRIGQMIIMPFPEVEFVEADELSETDRGIGGYGSTGK